MKDVTMKNILKSFAAFGIAPLVALGLSMSGAFAEEGGNAAEPAHFPIHHPKQ
jgi:hypothetical protein